MDSLWGFREPPAEEVVFDQSHGLKLVPWINWDEWKSVRESLFSPSPVSVASALQRINAWRSRGCLPVLIDVTAVFIEIQQKDPFFRDDFTDRAVDSEEILATLYCMAIVRLVNAAIEKTRKKTEISIAEAASAKGIPRMLIDIRHECSHRDLPSLQLVRLGSMKALDWLKSYYWEPQKNSIPNEGDLMENIRKKIKRRLRELAICLKAKQRSGSALVKGTRSKKQLRKVLKIVLELYYSYSVEVVDVLLELLLKSLKSLEFVEYFENPQSSMEPNYVLAAFDDWKPVIKKLSNKVPGLLWGLLKLVLEKIFISETGERETDVQMFLQQRTESFETKALACLLEWLVQVLGSRKPVAHHKGTAAEIETTEKYFPKVIIVELLGKCLVVCSNGNRHLMNSAHALAQMLGNNFLNDKLVKLLSLKKTSDLDVSEEAVVPPEISFEKFLSTEKESIDVASKSLEWIKLHGTKSKNSEEPTDDDRAEIKTRWTTVKSWKPCPIGMSAHSLGSSGGIPVHIGCSTDKPQIPKQQESSRNLGNPAAQGGGIKELQNVKTGGKTSEFHGNDKENNASEGTNGRLLIDGLWKRVKVEELLAITSDIRILV